MDINSYDIEEEESQETNMVPIAVNDVVQVRCNLVEAYAVTLPSLGLTVKASFVLFPLHNQVALDYIGEIFSPAGASRENKIQCAKNILQMEVLPLGAGEDCETKISYYFGYRIHWLLLCALGQKVENGWNHYVNRNREFAGPLLGRLFRQLLRKLSKHAGAHVQKVDISTEVGVPRDIHPEELCIYTNYGCCSHPKFSADNKRLHGKKNIKALQGESPEDSGWNDLLATKGFLEYIDTEEEETALKCMMINGFTKYAERRTVEAMQGEDRVALDIWRGLTKGMERFKDNLEFTKPKTSQEGVDMDDVCSECLNEEGFQWHIEPKGFTKYAERRTVEAMQGEDRVALDIWRGLTKGMERFKDNLEFTKPKTSQEGVDMDDVCSECLNEEGFQWHIEPKASAKGTEQAVKGTTTLAIIGRNSIRLTADRRGKSLRHPHMVLNDNGEKFFVITPNIVATMASRSDICKEVLRNARTIVTSAFGPASPESIHFAALIVMAEMNSWETRNPGRICQAVIMIAGYCTNAGRREGIIYIVRSNLVENGGICVNTQFRRPSATGSGKDAALQCLKDYPWVKYDELEGDEEDSDMGFTGEMAIVAAAIESSSTGGGVQTVTMPRVGGHMMFKAKSVLKLLYSDYIYFSPLLSKSLFCVAEPMDYMPETESVLIEMLEDLFPDSKTHVISIQTTVIRIINFPDAEAAERAARDYPFGIQLTDPKNENQFIDALFYRPNLELLHNFMLLEKGSD